MGQPLLLPRSFICYFFTFGPKLWLWSRSFGEKEGIKSQWRRATEMLIILSSPTLYPVIYFFKSYGPISALRVTKTMLSRTVLHRCFNMHIINSKPRQTLVPRTCQPISHSAGPRKAPRTVSPSQSFPAGNRGLTERMARPTTKPTLTAKRFRWGHIPQMLQKLKRRRNQTWLGVWGDLQGRARCGRVVGWRGDWIWSRPSKVEWT